MSVRAAAVILLTATLSVGPAHSAGSSCARLSKQQQRERAEVIFDGVALPGPTARASGFDGLLSPARFWVRNYRKGSGPRVLWVQTHLRLRGGRYVSSRVGIVPWAGERWRIFGRRTGDGFVRTSVCAGSQRI